MQSEDKDIPLTYTRYQQRRLQEEGRISKGVCVGLAMRQVTQKSDEEDKAIALQNKYSYRHENLFLEASGECNGRRLDRVLLKTQEMLLFARLYIESNGLENKVNYPHKTMIQKKSSKGGSPEDALNFIRQESGQPEVLNIYKKFVTSVYSSKKTHVACVQPQEDNKPKGP